MKNQDTLVSKVFKAKYFPNYYFLVMELGTNPSLLWRSLWKSQQVLVLQSRWRIGDGSSINVMLDPWVRGVQGGRMEAPQEDHVYSLMAQELMDPHSKQWDRNKIEELFPNEISILQVPLVEDLTEGGIVWKEERDRIYSFKTCYKLWWQQVYHHNNRSMTWEWGSLWEIKAPPKTKHLIWRVCRGCLPTSKILRHHYVLCPASCQLCNAEVEDEWHILFDCVLTNKCWVIADIYHLIRPRLAMFNIARDVVQDICCKEDIKDARKVEVEVKCGCRVNDNGVLCQRWIWKIHGGGQIVEQGKVLYY